MIINMIKMIAIPHIKLGETLNGLFFLPLKTISGSPGVRLVEPITAIFVLFDLRDISML